jgi:predicted  nucleic acid-binding Zn-ribbon protein
MNGLDNLVDLIKIRQKNNEMNIDIENQIKGAEDDGAKCWNALGKTQKDIEVLRLQLDSYEGNWETIQKLNQTIIDYQNKIATLKTQVGAYENDKDQVNQLMVHLTRYQEQLSALEKQVAAFTNSDGDLTNLQGQYNNMVKEKNQLLLDYSESNKLTPGLTSDITTYNNTIRGIESAIKENDKTLNDLQNVYKNTKTSCKEKLKFIFVIGNNRRDAGTGALEIDKNQLINGLYVDIGNDGTTISTIAIEIWVNGNWKRITFPDGKDHYNLPYEWIKNKSYHFRFGTIRVSPSIWFYNPNKGYQNNHQAEAQKYGGNLASFSSKEEMNRIIKKFDNKSSCWIGGRRKPNYEWEWIDGSRWNFTNWHKNEPNNNSEGGLQLLDGGTWNDLHQNRNLKALYKLKTPTYGIPGLIKVDV